MEDEIPQELLAPLSDEERDLDEIDRPSISYWRNCWLRLKKDKLAMFGLAVIIVINAAGCICADAFTLYLRPNGFCPHAGVAQHGSSLRNG